MNAFRLTMVAPQESVDFPDVQELDAPAAAGRLTVLPGHQPLVCLLLPGEVRVRTAAGWQHRAAGAGVMYVSQESVELIYFEALPAPVTDATRPAAQGDPS